MRSTFCSVILIATILSISSILVPAIPVSATDPSSSISIEENSDLQSQAHNDSWPGDGSAQHPFIIDDLAIDGGSGTGIMIRNTDLNLIIRNCTFTDSVRCIDIAGSSNILIENNSFSGNLYGCNIYLQGSSNIVVANNAMIGNDDGLYISDSDNNAILNNTISSVRWDGIEMDSGSVNNTISHNTITGAIDSGIYLSMSDGNLVSYNTVSGAHYGVYLDSSETNLVSDNTLGDSEFEEIYLSSSNNNTLSGNTVLGGEYGIYGMCSDGNMISDNTVNGALSDDVLFEDSNLLTASNNTITGADNGIHLLRTDHSLVADNAVIDANVDSIFLEQSVNGTISRNALTDSICYQGIYLLDSSTCNIADNTVVSTVLNIYGIILSGIDLDSSNAHLDGNHLTDCLVMPSIDDDGNDRACINETTVSASNTVNGQPVCFFKNTNMGSFSVPANTGEVLLFNVTHADIKGLDLRCGFVFVGYSSNLTIEDSSIENAAVGIYLFESDHCSVVSNDIIDPQSCGIILESSQFNTISGNTVTSSGPLAMGCIFLMVSDQNTISDNTLTGGNIMMEESSTNLVGENVIKGADEGIYMMGSDNNTVLGNIIIDSSSYSVFLTDCAGNTLYSNVFVGNDQASPGSDDGYVQAYDDGDNAWNITSTGNYWSDWQGPDVVAPHGIVDQPYAIDGGAGAQDNLPMVMSTSPMTLSIVTPAQGSWDNTGIVMVRWTASDPLYGLAKIEISTDGTNWTDVTGKTSYMFTPDDGPHTVYLKATGNEGQVKTASTTYNVDTARPNVSMVLPHDLSYSNTGMVNVSWTASDSGSGIAETEVQVDTGPWRTVPGTSLKLTGILDGYHTVTVRTTDRAGNQNSASVRFSVDTVAPGLRIVTPTTDALLNSSMVSATWSAIGVCGINDYQVSIDGGEWTDVGAETSHSFASLLDGSHILSVKCEDAAGNWNQTSVSFTLDTIAPLIIDHSPVGSDISVNAMITVSFSERMNESSVNLVIDGVSGALAWTGSNVTFTPSSPLALNTTYTVDVRGNDIAGNSAELSWSFTTLSGESSIKEVIDHGASDRANDTTDQGSEGVVGGEIQGVIKDAAGNPIEYATVTLSNGMTTITDSTGHFIFQNVTAGTYQLNAAKAGFIPVVQEISASAGQTYELVTLRVPADQAVVSSSNDNSLLFAVGSLVIAMILLSVLMLARRRGKP